MIILDNPSDCTGCTACECICPKNAITMTPDKLGFKYPTVNMDTCVECGLCQKVCPVRDKYDTSMTFNEPLAFAARHKNQQELETSRSGGVFIAISDIILDNGGVVYGAGFDKNFKVSHQRATTKEDRDRFKGSKYVESDVSGIFRKVKKDLADGLTVLFSGTPCQIAGVKSFIGKKLRQNLFLADIVCHGVPGPYVWEGYLEYLKKKERGKLSDVSFREKKTLGWDTHKESYTANGHKKLKRTYSDLFYDHIMLRHSCGRCHFCNTLRPSDITLGDFWGWEKAVPDFNTDNKGISLILINTPKGKELFDKAEKDLNKRTVNLKDCLQPPLVNPIKVSPKRLQFEEYFAKKGFESTAKHFSALGLRFIKKRFIKKSKTAIRLLSSRLK